MSMNISGLGNTYNGINTNSKQYKALKEKGWLSGIMQNEAMMSSEERMIYETFGGRDTIINNLMKQFDSEGDLLNANGVAGMDVTGKGTSWQQLTNGYVAAYAELYDEIVQGYESGTREIYVTDENGTHKLTKDEELSNLDAAYKKTVDDFVTMETTNQHARGIIGEEMNKISKITTRSTLASAYIEEQKTRGKDEIPENLTEKMYGAITSFKEKYTMIQPNREQLLMSIKI